MSSGVNTVASPACTWRKYSEQRPVGRDRAQRRLPGVHVGVDQARQHEMPGAVDDLGAVRRELRRDRGNPVALDQHVAGRQHAERRVLRDDDAGPEEELHRRPERSEGPCAAPSSLVARRSFAALRMTRFMSSTAMTPPRESIISSGADDAVVRKMHTAQPIAHLHVLRFELHAGSAGQLEQQDGEIDVAGILVGQRLQALARRRGGRHRHALRLGGVMPSSRSLSSSLGVKVVVKSRLTSAGVL